MVEIALSNRASDEILQESDFLGASSPAYAKAFVNAIFVAIDRIRKFPQLGRTVPEYNDPAIREVFHRHYRIFYFVPANGTRVSITSIQSGRYPHRPLR